VRDSWCFAVSAAQSALYFADQPIALLWSDCEGSIGQLLTHAGTIDLESNIAKLRWLADGNLDSAQPLSTQVCPLLHLFANGEYLLRNYTPNSNEFDVIDHTGTSTLQAFYPLSTYIMTQPRIALDVARIEHFAKQILNGKRPIVFCARLESAEAVFILDGHHKLAAYQLCKLPPHTVEIAQLAQVALLPEQEQQFLRTPQLVTAHGAAKRRGRWP
jgi:hypothetical protein